MIYLPFASCREEAGGEGGRGLPQASVGVRAKVRARTTGAGGGGGGQGGGSQLPSGRFIIEESTPVDTPPWLPKEGYVRPHAHRGRAGRGLARAPLVPGLVTS